MTSVAENVREAGVRLDGGRSRRWTWPGRTRRPARPAGRWAGCAAPRTPSGRARRCWTRIDRLADDLAAAEQRLPAVRAETEKDLAEARSLIQARRPQRPAAADRPGRGGAHRGRRRAAAGRRVARRPADGAAAPRGGRPRPRAGAVGRAATPRRRPAAPPRLLDQALLTARSTTAAAADFISTRRGAVGPEARTRLAEAQRHLDAAEGMARQDPAAALARGPRRRPAGPVRPRGRAARRRPVVAADRLRRLRRRLRRHLGRWLGRRLRRRLGPRRGGMSPLGAGLGGLLLGGLLFGDHDNNGDWSSGDWGGGGFGDVAAVRRRLRGRLRRRRGLRRGLLTPAAVRQASGPWELSDPGGTVPPPHNRRRSHAHPRTPLAERHTLLGRLRRGRSRRHEDVLRRPARLGVHRRRAGVRRLPHRHPQRRAGRRPRPAAGPGRPAALDDVLRHGRRRRDGRPDPRRRRHGARRADGGRADGHDGHRAGSAGEPVRPLAVRPAHRRSGSTTSPAA